MSRLAIALAVAAFGAAIALPSTALAADTTKPVLQLDFNENQTPTLQPGPQFTIEGRATDDSGQPTLTVNGKSVNPAWRADGSFIMRVTLPYGDQDVHVAATDGAGNVTQAQAHIYVYHRGIPAVSIASVNRQRARIKATDAAYVSIAVLNLARGRGRGPHGHCQANYVDVFKVSNGCYYAVTQGTLSRTIKANATATYRFPRKWISKGVYILRVVAYRVDGIDAYTSNTSFTIR
jgi:hypothetical protein